MRKLIILCCILISSAIYSQNPMTVSSPDGYLKLNVLVNSGKPAYSVTYKGKVMLEYSPIGLITNEGDFSSYMSFVKSTTGKVDKVYTQDKIKRSLINYKANTLKCTFVNAQNKQISVLFQVNANDIAIRYELPTWGERVTRVVEKEATGFRFPSFTTTFLSPMMRPMGGFARTSPSYESGYEADAPMENTSFPEGYAFPGLFHVGDNGWVLISESGVRSLYCASHLSRYNDSIYTVEYPNPKQNNGLGSAGAQIGLPGVTPWRIISVGETLKPIVETTISFDVVDPLFEPSQVYKYGRGT
jgi:hypothetical protein